MSSLTRRAIAALFACVVSTAAGGFGLTGPSALAAAGPARLPNTQPYRVTATATATGRTGSAVMSARALIDRDHHALLEVAAGDFVERTLGTLMKVQLKAFDGNGDLAYANNYSGLNAPSMAVPLDGLDRGQALDVQGNIRNADNTRTDVVSVTAVARLRPDLAVLGVTAPASARVWFPVHINATVGELNHDTGARANCVLFVDDAEVDRAAGIWVDAGDTVSCAFAYSFSSGGSHQFRVDVNGVNPGDWNTSNNSGGGSVAIVADEEPFESVSAWASEVHEHYRSHNTGYSRRPENGATYVRSFDYLTDRTANTQGALYAAYVQAPLAFPVTQVAVSQMSGDDVIHQGVYNSVAATSVTPYITCAHIVDAADVTVYVDVCSRPTPTGPVTLVVYNRYAGTVTYFSGLYDAAWYEFPEGTQPVYTYSSNQQESSSTGFLRALGDTYKFEVTVTNGAVAYSHPVLLPLGPLQVTSNVDNPWTCREFTDPLYGYKKMCDEFVNYSAGRFASVEWRK